MPTRFILFTIISAIFASASPAEEWQPTPGGIVWTESDWPADGKVQRPAGIGNITAAYLRDDEKRTPLTIEFNKDASVVTIHGPKSKPAGIVLELAETSGLRKDGCVVFSALDAKVVGKQAKLETHPGNHRIGFWGNANDYVRWENVSVPAGSYTVELTYSTASPSGTEGALEFAGRTLPIKLTTTGSWYRYTTIPAGSISFGDTSEQSLNVKCTKKVGGAVMNLKAVVLRPG